MVEPGGARTAIFDAGRLVHGPALSAYASTAARQIRELLESGTYVPSGDPVKMMRAVIDSADLAEATRRLALGSDAYSMIHEVLTKRLAAL